jgi:hypothetical protein
VEGETGFLIKPAGPEVVIKILGADSKLMSLLFLRSSYDKQESGQ